MILVIGARGMLGQDLMALLADRAIGADIEDVDITSPASIQELFAKVKPSIVINCAAYTDVDGCEANTDMAMEVNGEGVAYLAMACAESGAVLVQISTDYVFDGCKGSPYTEDDATAPLSVYGESKLAGEMNARFCPEHLIVRTQWLYGINGKNFVETMLRIAADKDEISVVDDQTGSPTWTVDLARAVVALIDHGCRGTYHVAGSEFCTWNAFARAIFENEKMNISVLPMTTSQLARPANRPLYSTLDCSRLTADTGVVMPVWHESLASYLKLRK